ncbi:MAG: formylglycine-generating enzyme family protein, partial [Tannerellaceae bacterium]|nr:formylglycine-generating enzyme family protein [Tannerellaceae bacterium]
MKKYVLFIALFVFPLSLSSAPLDDTEIKPEVIKEIIAALKDTTYFSYALEQIETEKNKEKKQKAFADLLEKAKRVHDLQTELEWLTIDAVRLAFTDMKKMKNFDADKYQKVMDVLELQVKEGFDDIYTYKEEALIKAEMALANKRSILLANPLLDMDKVVATRFQLGERARKA